MDTRPLISIIVPIYNVEKYLRKCIESILNQTLENIEVILINDGSTDNCGKIIDEYEKQDKRVISIHKENGGQSSARNMGLDIAKGRYIGFIDSDDYIDEYMYESLYNAIENSKADICVCGRESYSEFSQLNYKTELEDELIDFNHSSIQQYVSEKLFYKHTVVVWNKLYKSEIISENNIRFKDVSYVGSEDALFNYEVLLHTKKIKSIDKIGYTQLSRVGSTATTYKYGYMNRTANMIRCMYESSIKFNKETIYKKISPLFLLFFYQWNMSNIKAVKEKDIKFIILEELKDASSNKVFMNCVKELGLSINLIRYMKNMRFRLKGIFLIKTIMILYYLKLYKIALKIILLR